MEAAFEKWLRESERVSVSSTEKYVRSIRAVSKDMMSEGVISKELYKINSYSEYVIALKAIMENDFFIEKNNRGNRMYSSALKKYAKFLSESFQNISTNLLIRI